MAKWQSPAIIPIGCLVLMLACEAVAQTFLTVTSTNDGAGLFSYSFSLGPDPYVWRLDANAGQIIIPSHGILDFSGPTGWSGSTNAREEIAWTPTNSAMFLGEPAVIFTVRSVYTNAVAYDQRDLPYERGLVLGMACSWPDHQPIMGGYQSFAFTGPEVVPEPSALALLLIGVALARTVSKG